MFQFKSAFKILLMSYKALYLDDDPEMHLLVSKIAPPELKVHPASTILEAKKLLDEHHFQIILVDLYLVGESGFDFIDFLKNKDFLFGPTIIIITSSQDENDEVKSHENDIFEYVHKPIRSLSFKALLEKHLRRFTSKNSVRKYGSLIIDEFRMEVKIALPDREEPILLTLKEYKLLVKLISNPDKPHTREELLADVWNTSSDIQSRTIDMYVSSLRKKLGALGEVISSRRGVGYYFDPEKAKLN